MGEKLELVHSTAFQFYLILQLRVAPRFREELESAIGVAAKAHGLPCVSRASTREIIAKAKDWAVDLIVSCVSLLYM